MGRIWGESVRLSRLLGEPPASACGTTRNGSGWDRRDAGGSGRLGRVKEGAMVPIRGLFETHLTVSNLPRSMMFFGALLGLPLARVFTDRKVAFYWVGS